MGAGFIFVGTVLVIISLATHLVYGLLMPAPLMMPSVYVEHFTTWCGGHGDYDGKHGGLHGTGRVSLLRIIVLRSDI